MRNFTNKELKELFDGRRVSSVLPYENLEAGSEMNKLIKEGNGRLSISGAQEKYAVVEESGALRLTYKNEPGRFIIKPVPTDRRFMLPEDMPANELLTMDIARDVFHLDVAAHGICFLGDGSPVYITRRFDYRTDGDKYAMEDLASVAGLNEASYGKDFKYTVFSYEECAELINRYCSAPQVDTIKLFRLVLFNFLFGNADAHLKNLSMPKKRSRENHRAPAYDLLNTQLHLDSPIFALDKGLFKEGTPIRDTTPFGRPMFLAFGERLKIAPKTLVKTLDLFSGKSDVVENMIRDSLMSDMAKETYWQLYKYRRSTLVD